MIYLKNRQKIKQRMTNICLSSSLFSWGAMWGSNPRHPEPQSGALPTELIAPCQFGATKVQRFFGIPREYSKKELSLCDLNKNRIREYVKRD